MPTFEPVDFDPFAGASPMMRTPADAGPPSMRMTVTPQRGPTFTPVDHDPFAAGGAPGGFADTAADVGKSLGIGTVKGAIGLAGLPGDLAEYGARGIDLATRGVDAGIKYLGGAGFDPAPRAPQPPTFGSADIRGALEQNVTGPLYEPKTTAGHYAQTVGEFLPGAMAGPGGMVRNAVNFGVLPGLQIGRAHI